MTDGGPNDSRPRSRTMRDVSHTHPYADEGALSRLFDRGPVATDGGSASDREPDRKPDRGTMADVSHTPPEGAGDAAEVFERGYESRVRYR